MPTIPSQLTKRQRKTFGPRTIDYHGDRCTITAEVRFDDECGNGHNTFSITGEIHNPKLKRNGGIVCCGCLHDEIAKYFPELAPFIKWHLCSSDGPLHYVANTVYHASDRDHWGGRKGEVHHVEYYVEVNEGGTLCDWTGQPSYTGPRPIKFRNREEAQGAADAHGHAHVREWIQSYHEGKEADLDAARESACWWNATIEDLTAPGLKERLEARLPDLLTEFRLAVQSLGFTW